MNTQQTIFRIKKKRNFTTISNIYLDDCRLSWKAKAILTYLLSKSDNWIIYIKHLMKQSKDGRDATYTGIQELVETGYIIKNTVRDKKGIIRGIEYLVYEAGKIGTHGTDTPKTPETPENPINTPDTGFPYPGFPDTENPSLPKTERKQKLKTTTANEIVVVSNNDNNKISNNQLSVDQQEFIERASQHGIKIKIPEWIHLFALYGIIGLTESMENGLKRRTDPEIKDFSGYLASCIRKGYGIKTEEERKQAEKSLIDEARKSKIKSIANLLKDGEDGGLVRWVDGNTYEIDSCGFLKGLKNSPYHILVAIADGQAEILGKTEKSKSATAPAAEIKKIPEIAFQTPKKRRQEKARVIEKKARVSEEESRAIIAEQKRRLAESELRPEKPEQRAAIRFPKNPSKRFPEPLRIKNFDALPEYDRLAARTLPTLKGQ